MLSDRFMAKVSPEPNAGCWLWMGKTRQGYGRVCIDGRERAAHRVAFETVRGLIPIGKELDHVCRIRCCVNPWHLDPVTHRENLARSPLMPWKTGACDNNSAKTACHRGHPFDAANTWVEKDGRRHCRACHREAMRVRRA